MKNKIITLLISFSLICSSLVPCFGVSLQNDPIEIKDLYDYLTLEYNCRLDRYSLGKTFVLTRDIDLEGRTINGLASFSGIFDGQGHTICNFVFSNQSEACGLFHYVERNGVVSNLKVAADINYDNPSTIIGGIAGVNYGVIDHCEFSGALKSSKTLGGIVGSNAQSGMITNSVNRSSLISMEQIGGIAGENSGQIIACRNIGNINAESIWVDEQDDIDIGELIDLDMNYQSGRNIGGIAGYNEGSIEDCCNGGTIGYFRSGDNVGGIAGYHNGQLKACSNSGSIFGKNNVGGIAGHMQPHIEEKQDVSLRPQIQELHDVLDKTIDDYSVFSDTLGEDVSDLTNQADIALQTADALTEELIDVSNENIDTLNDFAERIDKISDQLPSVTGEISASLKTLKTVSDDFKKIKSDSPTLTEEDRTSADAALDRLEINADDLSQTAGHAAILYDGIYDILTDDDGNVRTIYDLSSSEKGELENLSGDLIKDLIHTGKIAAEMISDLAGIADIVRPYINHSMDAWDADLNKLSDDIDVLISHLQKASDHTTDILNYWNRLDSLQAKGFSRSFSQKAGELNDTLRLVNDILNRLNDNTSASSKVLEYDLRSVNNQLNQIMNRISDYADSIEDQIKGDVYNDLSYSGREYKDASRIMNCTNKGIIDGCRNIGGIAGNMDVETIYSVEDSTISIGNKYDVYAIIKGCSNTGFVIVKNMNGGGITGCSAKGYISDCFSSGIIEGENASYLGGIAGKSNLRIDSSYSMAELSGKEYIGGIAGNAEEIHDCMSLVRIIGSEGRSGAILGADMPESSENDPEYRAAMNERIRNNYFCSKDLFGIDGVSYANCAEPLEYRELCEKENAPDEFKNLKIIFLDPDHQIVQELPIKYGEGLMNISYPEIDSESGKHIVWSGLYSDIADGNVFLRSEFIDYVTVIASAYKISGRPAGYVGGKFEDSVKLLVEMPSCAAPDFIDSKALMHLYDVKLIGNDMDLSDVLTLRLYLGDAKRGKAYILKDDHWEEIQSIRNGSYLEISMQGDHNIFCVAEENSSNTKLWIACSIAAVFIICFVLMRIKKHRNSM